MYSGMNWKEVYAHHEYLERRLERAGARRRLAGLTEDSRRTAFHLLCPFLAWLGRQLSAWGQSLEARYDARPLSRDGLVR